MLETLAFLQEPLSQVDWYKEGGLGAVALILFAIVIWLLRMYLKEREQSNERYKNCIANRTALYKENADIHKDYARAYRELLERVLISDHHGVEALDKLRMSLEVVKRMEQIEQNVNKLHNT